MSIHNTLMPRTYKYHRLLCTSEYFFLSLHFVDTEPNTFSTLSNNPKYLLSSIFESGKDMFFCASIHRSSMILERSIGSCPFCHASGTMDLVQQNSKSFIFGLIPTNEQVERLAVCRKCRKMVREAHYNLRESQQSLGDDKNVAVVEAQVG